MFKNPCIVEQDSINEDYDPEYFYDLVYEDKDGFKQVLPLICSEGMARLNRSNVRQHVCNLFGIKLEEIDVSWWEDF